MIDRFVRIAVLFLALLFFSTAILKGEHAPAFRNIVGTIVQHAWSGNNPLPEPLRYPGINLITTLVIIIEAGIAAMLVFPPLTRIGLKFAMGTLACFTLILGYILLMPNPPSCGCLGGAGTSSANATTDAVVGIIRNISLVVLILWILKSTRQPGLESERALEIA